MDLKPCPFCGHKKLRFDGIKGRFFWQLYISCPNCGIQFSVNSTAVYCGEDESKEFELTQQTKEKLALAWNRRMKNEKSERKS